MFWSAGCSHLRAEGFSCRLCVLCGGLRISKLQFRSRKYTKKSFTAANFFQFFGHQNPGFGNGSGSALNQWGSTTQGGSVRSNCLLANRLPIWLFPSWFVFIYLMTKHLHALSVKIISHAPARLGRAVQSPATAWDQSTAGPSTCFRE